MRGNKKVISPFRYQSNDQELISRFRYLTGKRGLGGRGYPGVPRAFDSVDADMRSWFERHDVIGGGSIADMYFSPGSYRGNTPYDTLPPSRIQSRQPMWWDEGEDPNMTVIRDHQAEMKALLRSGRFYSPRAWPGVFPEGPQERYEREQAERQKERDREQKERDREDRERAEARRLLKLQEEAERQEVSRADVENAKRRRDEYERQEAKRRDEYDKSQKERQAEYETRARAQAEHLRLHQNLLDGWHYNPKRPSSMYDEHVDLLLNMRLSDPLPTAKGRVWKEYVMINEADFRGWNSSRTRQGLTEVCRGHGKIIFRLP